MGESQAVTARKASNIRPRCWNVFRSRRPHYQTGKIYATHMIRWPFITRKEHEAMKADLEQRLVDIERHFVTKRDDSGHVIETLADRQKRRQSAPPPKRLTMQQLCKWLAITDGGRNVGQSKGT